jgi:hypothetical protein
MSFIRHVLLLETRTFIDAGGVCPDVPPLPERSTHLALLSVVGLLVLPGLAVPAVAGGAVPAVEQHAPGGPVAAGDPVVAASAAGTTTTTASPTGGSTATPGDDSTATPTPTPSPSPTSTPTDGDPRVVVESVEAPERIRPGDSFALAATVTNRGNATGTGPVEYVFDGSVRASREVSVAPGETRTVRFDLSHAALGGPNESVPVGTYVHGVRTPASDGVARYLRVTPDVDLVVDGFDAPAEASADRTYVVLATLSNPANATVTRTVTYRFDGTAVASKTVTVSGGERQQVAFSVSLSAVRAAGASVRSGTTYDHAVVADGGGRAGDAVRLVEGPTADASALVVESFDGPDDVRSGERYGVNATVRNVDTVAFDGRLTYRVDGVVLAAERASVPAGERTTVRFRIAHEDVARTVAPLSEPRTEQGVWVGNASLVTRPVTVHGLAADATATPTATPRPTLADPSRTATATPRPTATATESDAACQRGFFTPCGGTSLDQTTLTIIGTVTSVLGIVYELFSGN